MKLFTQTSELPRISSDGVSDERAELHFLAAMMDELMRALHANGMLPREQLEQIESAVSVRTGSTPRAW